MKSSIFRASGIFCFYILLGGCFKQKGAFKKTTQKNTCLSKAVVSSPVVSDVNENQKFFQDTKVRIRFMRVKMRNKRFTTWIGLLEDEIPFWDGLFSGAMLVSGSVSVSNMEKWWLKVWIHLWLHVACFKVSWNVLASIFFQSCWTWKMDSKSKKTPRWFVGKHENLQSSVKVPGPPRLVIKELRHT